LGTGYYTNRRYRAINHQQPAKATSTAAPEFPAGYYRSGSGAWFAGCSGTGLLGLAGVIRRKINLG